MIPLFQIHGLWVAVALPLLVACSSRPDRTIENLKNAVTSETGAAVRYRAFAVQAEKEGFVNISNLLEAIARSEEIHAVRQRKALSGYGEPVGETNLPLPRIGSTRENLKMSLRTEHFMSQTVFPIFEASAAAEGATEADQLFRRATAVSVLHSEYCRNALDKLENEGSDWNVVNSWSVCPRCGCPYMTAKLRENCNICEEPASSFILCQ